MSLPLFVSNVPGDWRLRRPTPSTWRQPSTSSLASAVLIPSRPTTSNTRANFPIVQPSGYEWVKEFLPVPTQFQISYQFGIINTDFSMTDTNTKH